LIAANLLTFYTKAKAIGFGNTLSRVLGRMFNIGSRTAGLPENEDALQTHERYGRWDGVIPLPNSRLMDSTGSPTIENFLVVGDSWSQVVAGFIKGSTVILDIGCGCGKTARFLARHPNISRYIGFDTIRPSIRWNQNFITPNVGEHFVFYHIDVHSETYNPTGQIKCTDVRFPAEEASVDLAFAASLFTHLLQEDCAHYLAETARCLAPGGKALLSIHASNSADTAYSGDEFRANIDHGHFINMASREGLSFVNRLDDICGQQVYIFEK
jgi:SAM-dependent methyltransferase